MDISTTNQLAEARGYHDWIDAQTADKTAMLARAGDFISTYPLRSLLTTDEQAVVDLATFLVARDMLVNGAPATMRASANVTKSTLKGAGFEKTSEFGDAALDPYPDVTKMLTPLFRVTQSSGSGMWNGMLSL